VLGIVGLVALIVVLGLSLLVTHVATIALTTTGLSREAARFQARSAWTGTGFTTAEAESVVDHPVRRRIVMLLMVIRSAGLVSIVLTLILSFAGTGGGPDRLTRLLWLMVGVVLLWIVAQNRWVVRGIERVARRALGRWTDLEVRDYAGLLKLAGEYTVVEMKVEEDDWVAGRSLRDCNLTGEGILVLGIERASGRYVGAPQADTEIRGGDVLILYGRDEVLEELDERRADPEGDRAHDRAVSKQDREVAEQQREERAEQQQERADG